MVCVSYYPEFTGAGLRCISEQSVSKQMGQQEYRSLYRRATISQQSDRTDPELILISKAIALLLTPSPTSPGLSLFCKMTSCMKGKSACLCSGILSKHVCCSEIVLFLLQWRLGGLWSCRVQACGMCCFTVLYDINRNWEPSSPALRKDVFLQANSSSKWSKTQHFCSHPAMLHESAQIAKCIHLIWLSLHACLPKGEINTLFFCGVGKHAKCTHNCIMLSSDVIKHKSVYRNACFLSFSWIFMNQNIGIGINI